MIKVQKRVFEKSKRAFLGLLVFLLLYNVHIKKKRSTIKKNKKTMTDWYSITANTFESFWVGFLSFLPALVGAVAVFILGWFFAIGMGKITAGVLHKIKFNSFFENKKWKEAMDKAEMKVDPSEFLGTLVKWILTIVVIWMAVEILGFNEFALFMKDVVAYLPNVIVAALIFVVAVMVADFLAKIIMATTEKVDFPYAKFAGAIVKTAIWVFALFAILIQLGIARELMLAMFYGLIALVSLAGGLAFGLGGREAASEFIKDVKKKLK